MLLALAKCPFRFLIETRHIEVSHAFYNHVIVLSDDTMTVKLLLCMSLQNQAVVTVFC